MTISVASYSFHGLLAEGAIDAFGYLESVRYRYGLRTADIWNGILSSTSKDYVAKVRRAIDEREMSVVNYHADGPHVWDDDPAARAANRAQALGHLRVAAQLGAATVRIDTGGALQTATDEQIDTLAAAFREYCAFGNDHGFTVGPENHWGLSLYADNMERLARAVDHPSYGVLLHIGHWEDGDEEGGDRRLAPWTSHTHVDARITRSCLEERIRLLVASGYTGCWGVEHHSAANEYAEVACQLAEVQRVLQRLNLENRPPATDE